MKFCKNILAVSIASAAIFGGCSSDSHIAGNSAETGSPELAGIFLLDNGNPAAFARVNCVPSDFDATSGVLPAVYSTETDSAGHYSLDSIPAGTYAVEAFHEESGKRLLVQNVNVTEDDSIAVSDTLRDPGIIKFEGIGNLSDGATGIATVLGTTIHRNIVVHEHTLLIDSLPVGKLDLLVFFDEYSSENPWAHFNIDVVAGDTETILEPSPIEPDIEIPRDSVTLTFVAPLALPKGTDTLNSVVTDIPIALRLTEDECNFDSLKYIDYGRWEAARISKDGRRRSNLPIRYTGLDRESKEMIIWVRVDSLNVDDSLEVVYDGLQLPVYALDIFPTNRSYSLMYHFDSGTAIKDDAEKGYFNGSLSSTETSAETATSRKSEGVLGSSIALDAATSITATNSAKVDSTRKVNLSFGNGQFSFSLWINLESLNQQTIFEKADEYALRYNPDQGFVVEFYATDTISYKQTWASGTEGIEVGKWIFIAFSKHSIPQTSYFINGTPIKAEETSNDWDGNRELADLKIGGFAGKIDEFMLGSAFRDDSWTRLTYLNQNPEISWPKLSARK
ncbi:LamG-like jellyroll fold domain-containing protein [Fibrobacter sp.]|uniref:LamG-like jellyroll fold domain-containing protein n=1 Tax=Fibrobacter sp. TaxID=35828 RepID=UPI0038701C01